MFIGAINQDVRAILYEMAENWRDKEIYVGCSGNFTVERVLFKAGVKNIHSNDVSLYSCCLGRYLTREKMNVDISDPEYEWLDQYMKNELDRIATLLLCSEMFKYADRQERYFKRMWQAYTENFAKLHEQTKERVAKALDGVRIKSFYAGDVVDFVRHAPDDAVIISFPPTYKSGYERMYKKIDEVFTWERPDYEIFDDNRFPEFISNLQKKHAWVTLRDKRIAELESYLRAITQNGMRSKPVYVYAQEGHAKLTMPRQKIEPLKAPRFAESDEITPDSVLTVSVITQGQMNLLRSEYLSPNIIPAPAMINIAVIVDGKVIGAIAFSDARYTVASTYTYMMSDFAVRPTKYRRLSKLVLAAALSKEIKAYLEQVFSKRIDTIITTAFTEKAVSMKYRGLFDLYNRKEGMLNYTAEAGRWNLGEGLKWWLEKHSHKLKN
jgi:hypothetical protein